MIQMSCTTSLDLTATFCCHAQILEEHAELTFHLQQQRLIELIRGGDADAALAFAQDILAPLGEEHPAFLAELGAQS
jgi:CTLH/CRA C-terminal to LisH motif domain